MTPPMADDDEDCHGYAMCPDKGDDKETAMAWPNEHMVVNSSHAAIISPHWIEGANGVGVMAGETNHPFMNVEWHAKQSIVVGDGVTFVAHRVTIGAGQEMEPTGEIMYITCGPFACSDAAVTPPSAPESTIANSAACEGWDSTSLELMVGVIDPDGAMLDGDNSISKGFDLGWVYTANTKFTVKHDFGVFDQSGGEVAKGSDQALPAGRSPRAGTERRRDIVDGTRVVIDEDGCGDAMRNAAGFDLYGGAVSDLNHPDNCFRLSSEADYLSQYSVELTPKDAGVSWGEIAWDAFKELKCEAKTFVASEQLDVCELLEAEVDEISGEMSVVPVVGVTSGDGANGVDGSRLAGFDLVLPINQNRWTALNYYDTTTPPAKDTNDLYDKTPIREGGDTDDINQRGRVNGYTNPTTGNDEHRVWVKINDDDGDPMYGDLGKVDAFGTTELVGRGNTDRTVAPTVDTRTANSPAAYGGDDRADNYLGNSDAMKCSADDGGEKTSTTNQGTGIAAKALSDGDGTLCDAEDVEIETSITFTDGMGFECAVERTYTLTCQWDSSGGRKAGTIGSTRPTSLTQSDADNFVHCTVS